MPGFLVKKSSKLTGRIFALASAALRGWWKSVTVASKVGWLRARLRMAPMRLRLRTAPARVRLAAAPSRARLPLAPALLRSRRPRVQPVTRTQLVAAAVTGAGIEYLLDPTAGKRRRHVLRDRGTAISRRVGRRSAQRAQYAGGMAAGAVREAASAPSADVDDRTLADRVRSELFRRADAPKDRVNVAVVDAIVYLRGEVSDREEIERLVADARSISGVRAVESMLHTPGTPAPTGGAG